jgi:hypothetical protein
MENKRQSLVILLLILCLVPISPLTFIKVHAASFSATLDPKNGGIGIKKAGSANWTAVTEATLVGTGDLIGTGQEGAATLTIPGSVTVDVTSASIVRIEQLEMRDSGPGLIFGISTFTGIIRVHAAALKPADRAYFLTPTSLTITSHPAEFIQIVNPDHSAAIFATSGSVTVIAPDGDHIASGDTVVLVSGVAVPEGTTALTDDILRKVITTEIKEAVTADNVEVFKNLLSQLLQHNTISTTNIVRKTLKLPVIDKTADLAQANSEMQAEIDKISADDVRTTANSQAPHLPSAPDVSTLGLAKRADIDGPVGTQQGAFGPFMIASFIDNCDGEITEQDLLSAFSEFFPDFLSTVGLLFGLTDVFIDLTDAFELWTLMGPFITQELSPYLEDGDISPGELPDVQTNNSNPGSVAQFSTTGGARCTVTTTTDVNERSLDTGEVVGVASAGSNFTVVGTNNNGWVTDGNFSVARDFTTASAGCPQ